MGATVTYGPHHITVSRSLDTPLVGIDEDCGKEQYSKELLVEGLHLCPSFR